MCGIVGVINLRNRTPLAQQSICNLFDQALWADMIRGSDATGVMALTGSQRLETLKVAGSYNAMYNHGRYASIQNFTDSNYFTIGHNRSATRGSKNKEANAHPFVEDNIALVHNGTLTHFNDDYRDKDWEHNVDSKALAKIVAKYGLEEGTKHFHGAYAVVWIDKETKKLHVARNTERPLGWVQLKDYWLIGSEPHMMAWLAVRNGLGVLDIGTFDPLKEYVCDARDIGQEVDTTKFTVEDVFTTIRDIPETKPVFTEPLQRTTVIPFGAAQALAGTGKKGKFRLVKETVLNATERIVVDESLVEFYLTSIKPAPQGNFVSFRGKLKMANTYSVEVMGNLAGTWAELVRHVERPKITYLGQVSNIAINKLGNTILQVKDVELYDDSEPTALSPAPVKQSVVQQIGKILQLPIKLSKGNFVCNSCGKEFPESMERKWTRQIFNDDSRQWDKQVFHLCPTCITSMASIEMQQSIEKATIQ